MYTTLRYVYKKKSKLRLILGYVGKMLHNLIYKAVTNTTVWEKLTFQDMNSFQQSIFGKHSFHCLLKYELCALRHSQSMYTVYNEVCIYHCVIYYFINSAKNV